MYNTKLLNGPLGFIFKEIPDEKSRHQTEIYNFFPLPAIIKKYNLFYVSTVPYRVKSSSLFVKWGKFYNLHGKELNFNTLSLLPFFRLLDFVCTCFCSDWSQWRLWIVWKKRLPRWGMHVFQNNNLSEKGLKQNLYLDLRLNIYRLQPPSPSTNRRSYR